VNDKELLVPVRIAIVSASEILTSIPNCLSEVPANYARRRRVSQFLFAASYALEEWYDALEDKHDCHR
jgi:hypothetical protein